MVLFLRDQGNNTIYEVEIWTEIEDHGDDGKRRFIEMSTNVNILHYSKHLIQLISNSTRDNSLVEKASEFVTYIDDLSELRGWMWENYFMVKDNDGSDEDEGQIIKMVREKLKQVANTYDLNVVED